MTTIKSVLVGNFQFSKPNNEGKPSLLSVNNEEIFQSSNMLHTGNFEPSVPKQNETDKNRSKTVKKILIATGISLAVIGSLILLKKSGALDKLKNTISNRHMTDADSKELFYFAKKHPINAPGNVLSEDGLVLTHMTDYLPNNDCIDTARSAAGCARDSVHFAVNHGVTSHMFGNWDGKPYAIITPMKSTLNMDGNKFVGGVAADFFSKGKVRLPKDAVIVRYNAKIPAGKYKISNASKIKELCGLRGIKLIETSEQNMKTNVDNIVQKLGYELKDAPIPWFWGNLKSKTKFKEMKRFNDFLKSKGMVSAFHTYTPNGKTEYLLEALMSRNALGLGWTYERGGKLIVDAKDETLELLDYIKNYAGKTKYPLDFDIPQLKNIISKAETPQIALDEIGKTMKITTSMTPAGKLEPLITQEAVYKETALQGTKAIFIGGRSIFSIEKALLEYIAKPCKSLFDRFIDSCSTQMDEIMSISNKLCG